MIERSKLTLMTFPMDEDIQKKRLTYDDVFRLAVECGLSYLDVMHVSKKAIPQYVSLMEKYKISVYCYIDVVSLFLPDWMIRASVKAGIKTAKSLRAEKFMIVPYIPVMDTGKATRWGREKTLQKLAHGFAIAVREGRQQDIPICFETTPRSEIHLSGTKDCLEVLTNVSGLEYVHDTANMLPAGEQPLTAFETMLPYTSHIHLKDVTLTDTANPGPFAEVTGDGKQMTRCRWGDGVIPIQRIVQTAKAQGYQGKYAIEYASPELSNRSFADHKQQLQLFLQHLDCAAEPVNGFLREQQ